MAVRVGVAVAEMTNAELAAIEAVALSGARIRPKMVTHRRLPSRIHRELY